MSGLFKTALAAGGVAAGAALVAGLTTSLETEAAEKKLAAQLGGSEWAQSMGDVAGNLYMSGFGESVSDTAAALKTTLQAGLLPEDATNAQVESMTEKVLTFSDVLDQDLGMATQAVANMVKTGIAKDSAAAFDILTRGVQQGADRAGDLLETFQEYSGMFDTVGLSAAEATGLMTQGLQAGARDADKVADALKEFGIRAKDGSEASAAGFELIGLNAKEMTAAVAEGGPAARQALDKVLDGLRGMEDPVARNAAAVALFGTQAEDMGDALFAMDLDGAAQRLGNVEGATAGLGEAYETNQQKIEQFRRKAMDKLADVVSTKVIPAVEGITKWAQDNPGAFKVIAGVIGGALVLAFTAWAVSAASAAVATIAATWPILAIGAAVAGLAALVVIHWDTILGAFKAVWNWVKDNWQLLFGFLSLPISLAVGFITSHWDKITGAAKAAFNWVRDNWKLVLGFITGPIGAAVAFVTRNWDKIKNGFRAVVRAIRNHISNLVSTFRGLPGRISRAVSGMWDGIKSAFRSAINFVIRGWNNLSFTLPSVSAFGKKIGGQTISTPNIPLLAQGGVVTGPTLLVAGEGGEDEAIAPLSDLKSMVFDAAQMAALHSSGSSAAAAPVEIVIDGDGSKIAEALRWTLAQYIRGSYGGNVVGALGGDRTNWDRRR